MEEKGLLGRIQSPGDLKQLNVQQLDQLCAEIRAELIEVISQNGGHLASNLGVVELTVALHRVFDSPKDQIVWDVGHQCYAHKLLTGRQAKFATIRKSGGLSGFTKRCESEHDPFGAGHSSTSISAAEGLARAKTLQKSDDYTIAVIGDGALTGGLAWEGINNAARSRDRLIVILNDNEMSISRNVGALARHLAVIRMRPWYFRIKDGVEAILSHIPFFGPRLRRLLFRIKSALKNFLYSSTIFEEMGFAYLGPADGHNLADITRLLQRAKALRRPVLIHLMTVKGKGYSFAENDPKSFHGVGHFDIETGESAAGGDSFSGAFGAELTRLADQDERSCAVTAAMAEGTGLSGFAERHRSRFFDVGIAEEHAAVFCGGLAANGMLPVFAVYSTFLQRAFDQLLHDVALQKLHVVFALDRAGLVGEDGETHQGIFDAAFLSIIPGITVYSPSGYAELCADLRAALYDIEGPVAVRYPRGGQGELPAAAPETAGPWALIPAAGDDATPAARRTLAVTYGRLFTDTLNAAAQATLRGIPCDTLKLNRIQPIDDDCIRLAAGYGRVVFFEEGVRTGGVGERFALRAREAGLNGACVVRAIDDRFVRQAPIPELLTELGLDTPGMLQLLTEDAGGER